MHDSTHNSVLPLATIVTCGALLVSTAGAAERVRGYFRKDGTYVAPYYRSTRDGQISNNWSTKGNINPYTGAAGTRVAPPSKIASGKAPSAPSLPKAPRLVAAPDRPVSGSAARNAPRGFGSASADDERRETPRSPAWHVAEKSTRFEAWSAGEKERRELETARVLAASQARQAAWLAEQAEHTKAALAALEAELASLETEWHAREREAAAADRGDARKRLKAFVELVNRDADEIRGQAARARESATKAIHNAREMVRLKLAGDGKESIREMQWARDDAWREATANVSLKREEQARLAEADRQIARQIEILKMGLAAHQKRRENEFVESMRELRSQWLADIEQAAMAADREWRANEVERVSTERLAIAAQSNQRRDEFLAKRDDAPRARPRLEVLKAPTDSKRAQPASPPDSFLAAQRQTVPKNAPTILALAIAIGAAIGLLVGLRLPALNFSSIGGLRTTSRFGPAPLAGKALM